ncbi:MAG: hypothetical protein Q8L97_08790 [Nitrosomonas sp.]|uniref:hypothetical protein n=1 Tax=Nitrosomonas sp. TaxID=42353 RepID=UPI002731632E|nr:hypothetical protein [Nitrosomonas sp.]MDP1550240.1 hypothetical protein [Nitrosomonas sp.]
MVRQARHERNQYITVRPVEGLNQSFLKYPFEQSLRFLELRNSTVRYTCLNPRIRLISICRNINRHVTGTT